jgi:bcr-type benzoyl-CoA reductase subunit B
MSVLETVKYHAGATIAGQAFLRWERVRLEMKMRRPGFWRHEHLGPPLAVSPRLKELISRHYLKGRYANPTKKVAWVTSGAPVELLVALGFFPMYPENHGAVCGIRRKAEEISVEAENAGYSRDVCSYARTDIGAMLSGKTPVGRLPKPDLLVCCTNICQTVLLWYRVLADHFRVPLVVIDTPFLYGEARPHDVEFVKKQLEAAAEVAERVSGRRLEDRRLREVTRLAKDASDLWRRAMEMGMHRPSPITAFDEFIHMAPIVEMRGEAFTVDYYAALVAELEARAKAGVGALKHEKRRVIWDNLPIWHRVRWLGELLAERGTALVASTYTNAWGELTDLIDPDRPFESAARVYLHPILNRGTGHKLSVMKRMVESYGANGVILHSDRSCKPYSIGQVDQRDRLGREAGVPALLLEADHNDPRTFSEEQARARLDAFLEILEA